MNIKNFSEAQNYLYSFIPKDAKDLFKGDIGLERAKYLLEIIDNPQEKIKIIHIAGTSGKGSTAYLLSLLLTSSGQRAGLFLSPHIKTIRERIQINNTLLTEDQFVAYLNEIIPSIEKMTSTPHGKPTYFEILTALAFHIYYKEKVDYAVIETGLGGLKDATNVVSNNKICIITKLGLDHKEILGETIAEIAEQKAGIINANSIVISPEQENSAQQVLEKKVKAQNAKLFTLKAGVNFKNIKEEQDKTLFDFNFSNHQLNNIPLGLLGGYQAENCSLALAALILLSQRDTLIINENNLKKTLSTAHLFGRMTRYQLNKKNIILDGAHNEQKMEVFTQAIKTLYPSNKFNFLISFVETKEFIPMLKLITPRAKSIIVTSFSLGTQDLFRKSIDPEKIAKELSQLKFSQVNIIPDPNEAFKKLLSSPDKTDIIITGSFYLISALEKYEK